MPPEEKRRLDGYQTAKGNGLSDKADDDKKYKYQLAANRQGTGRSRLSFEILARLFPELEFKTTTEQPVTGRRLQGFTKLNIGARIAERRIPFVKLGKRPVRFGRTPYRKHYGRSSYGSWREVCLLQINLAADVPGRSPPVNACSSNGTPLRLDTGPPSPENVEPAKQQPGGPNRRFQQLTTTKNNLSGRWNRQVPTEVAS
jgi:hypothetical protein